MQEDDPDLSPYGYYLSDVARKNVANALMQSRSRGGISPSLGGKPSGNGGQGPRYLTGSNPGQPFGAGGLFSPGELGPATAANQPSGFGLLDTGGIGAAPIGGESGAGGASGAGAGAGAFALPAAFAALIGLGKNAQYNAPNSSHGKILQAMLGPSFNEVKSDPLGTGLPTALGAPFLLPWTGSKKARGQKPEWMFWK